MELCIFNSLGEWLKHQDDAPREIPRMVSWFKQMVEAVAYIHEKGLIHRNLKPSNILFTDVDHLKICDLGLATGLVLKNGDEVSNTYTNCGTPLYMAPEQGHWKYTSKVDVFTLGLILVELCIPMNAAVRKQVF
ncbi:hypothetical protein PMAYCL1PPCAC_08489, partial [Pristionchus mayeri]